MTYEASPRRWIALDVDGVPEPPCLTFAAEPEEGVEHVLGLVPEPFADASCWWQATASAGIKPGIRCRLWFWLSRPVSDAEAKGWLARAPVDRSLFSPVMPHYTAPPILETGTPDPVARRSGIRRGLTDVVEVPAELPAVETIAALPVALDGEELTAADLEALAAAVRRSPAVARNLDRSSDVPGSQLTAFPPRQGAGSSRLPRRRHAPPRARSLRSPSRRGPDQDHARRLRAPHHRRRSRRREQPMNVVNEVVDDAVEAAAEATRGRRADRR